MSINDSVISQTRHQWLRVTEFEEVCLQVTAEDGKWRSRCDMLWKTVPDPYSENWKCSVAAGTRNRQFVRWSETQMLSKLRLCRMTKFVSEIWRYVWVLSHLKHQWCDKSTEMNVHFMHIFSCVKQLLDYLSLMQTCCTILHSGTILQGTVTPIQSLHKLTVKAII